jgi:hypothetical protein
MILNWKMKAIFFYNAIITDILYCIKVINSWLGDVVKFLDRAFK